MWNKLDGSEDDFLKITSIEGYEFPEVEKEFELIDEDADSDVYVENEDESKESGELDSESDN